MEICIEKACCFTGHRPGKLNGTEEKIREELRTEIANAVNSGVDTFITGMAPGVDTWAALEVLKLKETNQNIKHICAVPFNGVEKNRTDELQKIFHDILNKSDDVVYIAPKYKRWCFHARNEWMVDHANRLIAVFNGTKGGTEFTIKYAEKKNRKICLIKD